MKASTTAAGRLPATLTSYPFFIAQARTSDIGTMVLSAIAVPMRPIMHGSRSDDDNRQNGSAAGVPADEVTELVGGGVLEVSSGTVISHRCTTVGVTHRDLHPADVDARI